MTPQQKAKELVDKYYQLAESIEWSDNETMVKAEKFNDDLGSDVLTYWNELAKKSALSAVDEVLDDYEQFPYKVQLGKDYWNEVKQEIQNL
jgi:hypothetical protein